MTLQDYEYYRTENGVLYCGDCLEILPLIDEKIDLCLTDMPYGTTACDWDKNIDLYKLWELLYKISNLNTVYTMTSSQPFTTDLINSNRKYFRYEWIWDKITAGNFMNIKDRPFKTHENICIFYKKNNIIFNPIRIKRNELSLKRYPAGKKNIVKKHKNYKTEHYKMKYNEDRELSFDGMKHPIDIIQFSISNDTDKYSKLTHPTRKPVGLMEYMIITYSNKTNLILDPFFGSGTTGVACERLGRRWIGIELSEKYCEIAKQRISAENAQLKFI